MQRVYDFGNGLSLAYSSDYYALPHLTERVHGRLAELEGPGGGSLDDELREMVDRLSDDQAAEAASDVGDFEALAGPLERLGAAVEHLSVLARLSDEAPDAQVIKRLARSAERLYRQVVGAVLGVVTAHVDGLGDMEKIEAIAAHLIERAKAQKEVDVYVLNYDALLDAGLLHFYRTIRELDAPMLDSGSWMSSTAAKAQA